MRLLILSVLLAMILAKEAIWVKEERFDPTKEFNVDRAVVYAPKGCMLDTMPGVSKI